MPVVFPPSTSISEIIKLTRDFHMVDLAGITLIKDLNNTPASDDENFNCSEGRAIISAVRDYNGDLPLQQVIKVSPISGFYDLTDIDPDWNHREFRITNIEWPIQNDSIDPSFMKKTFWAQTIDPTTGVPILKFNQGNNPGSEFAIHFTRPHVFSPKDNLTTVPEDHWEAVAKKAAAKILHQAAAKAASFSDQQTGYQSKDLASLQNRYLEQAAKYEEQYTLIVSAENNNFMPVIVEWDVDTPLGERVFHPKGLYS